jgi:hypothetical protein
MKNFITSYDNATKLFGGILSDYNKDGKTDNTDMYGLLGEMLGVDLSGYDGDETGVSLPDWLDSNPKDGKADDAAVVQKNLATMSPAARMDAISSFQGSIEGLKASITQTNNERTANSAISKDEQAVFDSYKKAGWISPERILGMLDMNFNTARAKLGDVRFMEGQVAAAQSVVNKINGFISNAMTEIDNLTRLQEGKTPAGRQVIQARIDKLRAFAKEAEKNRDVAVGKLRRNSEYKEAWEMYNYLRKHVIKIGKSTETVTQSHKDAWKNVLKWAKEKGYNIQ